MIDTQENDMEELINQSVQGNSKALNRLVSCIQDDVFNLALRMLHDPENARDATQEILLKIITHLSSFRKESSFKTWYYRIACNYLLNYRVKLSKAKTISFEQLGPMLESNLTKESLQEEKEMRLLADQVKTACTMGMLQCLTEEARLVYILGEILGISSVIGGTVMGITEANFRQLLSRSRKKITAFTQNYCGVVNSNAKCSCVKSVNRAISLGLIPNDKLSLISDNYVVLKSELEILADRTQGLFRSIPFYSTPQEVLQEVKKVLDIVI